jgi:hypothetical protein
VHNVLDQTMLDRDTWVSYSSQRLSGHILNFWLDHHRASRVSQVADQVLHMAAWLEMLASNQAWYVCM